MSEEVDAVVANGVLIVTIARPGKMNAITNEMYGALADAIERANAGGEVRALLIQAEGDMFTAGNDLAEFAVQAKDGGSQERHVVRFLRNLANTTVPVVAAVQGKAVGIGTTMLLHCDYVPLSEEAQLITPFVNLALVPEAGSSYLLPSQIGHVRAFEMFALGDPVSADKAVAWGIANRRVPVTELHTEARRIAEKFAAKPYGSLTATKRLMRNAERLMAQIDRESTVFLERLASAEAKEAFLAFAQKRRPDFTKIPR